MSTFRQILNSTARPYTGHIGIGKEQLRRLVTIKRENALRVGYERPAPLI